MFTGLYAYSADAQVLSRVNRKSGPEAHPGLEEVLVLLSNKNVYRYFEVTHFTGNIILGRSH